MFLEGHGVLWWHQVRGSSWEWLVWSTCRHAARDPDQLVLQPPTLHSAGHLMLGASVGMHLCWSLCVGGGLGWGEVGVRYRNCHRRRRKVVWVGAGW
jgi:hypothetical protein